MKVLTGGTFDLIHYGHLLHLEECERLAKWRSQVYVMLITDDWGRERKGEGRPVLSYDERKAILVAFGIPEQNIFPVGKTEDLAVVVRSVRPDYYVYEYSTNQEAHKLALKACEENNVKAVKWEKEPKNPFGTSTTSIIERIKG